MGDCRDFEAVIDCLPEFCCLAVDLPGHGQTKVSHDSSYQMEQTASGLIELLTALEIERCILVGYSMGGRLALYLTIHFPQFFVATVLESASPGLATVAERESRIARDSRLSDRLESVSLSSFLQQWYSNPLFESFRTHPNYQQAISRRLQNNPLKLAKSLRGCGLGKQPSLWEHLAAIEQPTLLTVGELDSKFREINQMMLARLPQARLRVIKHSGHNVHFEHPAIFGRLLKNFAADRLQQHGNN